MNAISSHIEKEIDILLSWVNERMAWRASDTDTQQNRLFAVPPCWASHFYEKHLAEATAELLSLGDEDAETVMVCIKIQSTAENLVVVQGPWENKSKAQKRLDRLLPSLGECHLPSLDKLIRIATDCGCEIEF